MHLKSPNSLAALTAARGIAAWWVVLYHFRDELPNDFFWEPIYRCIARGDVAVDFFFVLSGFIISLNYTELLLKPTWRKYFWFLVVRFGRIYPLHFVLLIAFLLNPIAISLWSTEKNFGYRYDPGYFLLSLVLAQNWGFTSQLAWNAPAWSISTEWAAYLLFPLNVWLTVRVGSTARRAALVALAFVAVLALCCYSLNFSLGAEISRFGLVRCLTEFGAGVALQRVWRLQVDCGRRYGITCILTAAGLLTLYLLELAPDFLVLPATFCLVVLSLASGATLGRLICFPALIMLGEISYSTYLVHYLIKDWVKFCFSRPGVPPEALLLLYLGGVALASFALYNVVEGPARKAFRVWSYGKISQHPQQPIGAQLQGSASND